MIFCLRTNETGQEDLTFYGVFAMGLLLLLLLLLLLYYLILRLHFAYSGEFTLY